MPCRSQTARTARRFSSETGWPPPELLVTVTNTTGTSAPRAVSSASSASTSMLPLNGWSADGSRPSAMTRSTASAPVASTFARVVSKWVLFGMTLPGPPMTENRIFSAARPWWVGMTWRNGHSSWTAARNVNQDGEPAYDSSPCWMAAHWSRLIAPVPESVSRSMRTSSAWRANRLQAGGRDGGLALGARRDADGLDGVDAEGLDDRPEAGHRPSIAGWRTVRACAEASRPCVAPMR